MQKIHVLVSETQLKAIQAFFSWTTEDILYWGAARWGKSEAIGIILAICISAFPWSAWLIARTVLSELKSTTLSTFFDVISRFGYGEKSYRDKVRDEKHIEFANKSKLYVIQVNYEPSDQEFDRLGSYWYTWAFLDEGQQMSNKVREVLQWRLSELDGSFSTEVSMDYQDADITTMDVGYEVVFQVVGETTKKGELPKHPDSYIKKVIAWPKTCHIIREETLKIPYDVIKAEVINGKLVHTYAWHFNWCIFTGCNPGTNFTRSEFYNPWKNDTLPPYMAFIPAKVNDNPWVDDQYIERLKRLPETSIRKQRLLYGNFDYDDNPWILYDQHTISQMFEWAYEWDRTRYIVVDAARQGKDKTEIGIWEGLKLVKILTIDKSSLVAQAEKIQMEMDKYQVPIGRVIVDEVWVGWGLVDMLWCVGFIGNAQPLHPYSSRILTYKKRNYLNLRTQAFYYLQRYMWQVKIDCDQDTKDQIIEELLTVKEKDVDNDSKLQIIAKKLMKEELWRSPDKADMLSMRMYFIIKDHHKGNETEMDNQILDDWEGISLIDELIAQAEKEDIFGKEEDFEPDLSVYG